MVFTGGGARIPKKMSATMVARRENFSILEALKTSYSGFENVLHSFQICTKHIQRISVLQNTNKIN